MLALLLMFIALVIIGISLWFSKQNNKSRISVGLLLIALSIISYPMLAPIFANWKTLEGVASLIVFNLFLLVGGIVTLIAGLYARFLSNSE